MLCADSVLGADRFAADRNCGDSLLDWFACSGVDGRSEHCFGDRDGSQSKIYGGFLSVAASDDCLDAARPGAGGRPAFIGILLCPLPFLPPVVSFSNYFYVLSVVRHHRLDPKMLWRSFPYLPLFLAPVLLAYFSRGTREHAARKQQTFFLALIASCMAISCVVGSKAGSGSYHLLPYAAPVPHLYFWNRSSSSTAEPDLPLARYAAAWVIVLLIFSVFQFRTLWQCLEYAPMGQQASSEIYSDESKYQGRALEVGVGNSFTDARTMYAVLPVLQGQPHTINSSSIGDLQFGGAAMPGATLDSFRQCKTPVWLIPLGQEPFTALHTFFPEPHRAFDAAFRSTFVNSYQRVASGVQYDIWTCKH